jgi:GNAT superfamily N-acetyltransferase
MCLAEYGTGPEHFPLHEHWLIGAWLERQALKVDVTLTMSLKATASNMPPQDHAVLLACVDDEQIVGMIEVSQQPVNPHRNPPPYPIPLWFKQLYGTVTNSEIEGWITNLLVIPSYRGQGYGKLLVAACEGVAKSWNCRSMHLHCDADQVRGKIAQKLYLSAGYEMLNQWETMVQNNNKNKDGLAVWTSQESLQNSVFFIDGVPLLYLRKDLTN